MTWWLWGEKTHELDFVKNRIPSTIQLFPSAYVHILLYRVASAQISVYVFNSWGWGLFIFFPEKQSGSPACPRRKPGLVPSSPHIPSSPLVPKMPPTPPAWTSAPETATDSSLTSPLTPKKQFPHRYSCWWGARTLCTRCPATLGWENLSPSPPPRRSQAAGTTPARGPVPLAPRPAFALRCVYRRAVINLCSGRTVPKIAPGVTSECAQLLR